MLIYAYYTNFMKLQFSFRLVPPGMLKSISEEEEEEVLSTSCSIWDSRLNWYLKHCGPVLSWTKWFRGCCWISWCQFGDHDLPQGIKQYHMIIQDIGYSIHMVSGNRFLSRFIVHQVKKKTHKNKQKQQQKQTENMKLFFLDLEVVCGLP